MPTDQTTRLIPRVARVLEGLIPLRRYRHAGMGSYAASFVLALCLLPWGSTAHALGPLNVLVLVNRNDLNSLAVANHYRLRREIPETHFVYLDYRGSAQECSWKDFDRDIYQPTLAHLRAKGLEKRVSVWVTTPGFPYRIGKNSISGVLLFGKELNSTPLRPGAYGQLSPVLDAMHTLGPQELSVRTAGKDIPNPFLHMLLWAGELPATLRLIDRSTEADGSMPRGTVYLFEGDGPRGSRKVSIPIAKRLLKILAIDYVEKPGSQLQEATHVLGLYTGTVRLPVESNHFVPGALGDHLTSCGGMLLDKHEQMLCLNFLTAGCSATYGAVVEPYNYPNKFPTALLYVYYALGFTAVESYFMSVAWPQDGLFVGDPLTRPFAKVPRLEARLNTDAPTVSGKAELEIAAAAADSLRRVIRFEIDIDDKMVAQLAPQTPPQPAEWTIELGGKRVAYQAAAGEPYPRTLHELQRLVWNEFGCESLAKGGNLFLMARPATDKTLRAENRSAIAHWGAISPRVEAGEATAWVATWHITGKPQAGDVIELTALQAESGVKLTYTVPPDVTEGRLAEALAKQWIGKLPYETRLSVHRTDASSELLRLVVDRFPQNDRRLFKLTVQPTASSTLKIEPHTQVSSLDDPIARGLDLGWLRVGFGGPSARLKIPLDTRELPDGLHKIRVTVYEGSGTGIHHFVVLPVVVRNQTARLKLSQQANQVKLGHAQTLIVKVEPNTGLEQVANGATMEFLINGRLFAAEKPQTAGMAESLSVAPHELGLGTHSIRARLVRAGKTILASDNECELLVLP